MNSLQLTTASLNDIVFEGRNQSYGAYVLRRIYNRHLITGLTISVLLGLVLVGIPIVVQQLWPAVIVAPAPVVLPPVIDLMPDPTRILEPTRSVEPVRVQPVTITPAVISIATTIVKDDLLKPQPAQPTESPVEMEPGALRGPGPATGSGTDAGAGSAGTTTLDSGSTSTPPANAPFVHVEVMPEFAGGIGALRQYMQRNLRYPRQALAGAVSGKVFVAFTVQASGAISDVQVLKGLGYGTDEEALRVVKAMPAWTPGRQNSHPVSVRYTLPITFSYQ
ncbi:energy transducer TonB [Hymenobacter fastidiosus]|uniref:Energy transducer TonB n=1 Tax=Hymenobacter fastidiosus TaxID=486264 RepID=A0ABP7RS18_9BACT